MAELPKSSLKSSYSSMDDFSYEAVDHSAKRAEHKSNDLRERAKLRAKQDEEEEKRVPNF